jgi:predicted secreted protein
MATNKLFGKNLTVSAGGIVIANKRDASFELNAEVVDTTDGDSGGFREKAFVDIQDMTTEVSGLMTTANTTSILSLNGTEVALIFEINNSEDVAQGTVSCNALCTNVSVEGSYDGVNSFSASFESNGEITIS